MRPPLVQILATQADRDHVQRLDVAQGRAGLGQRGLDGVVGAGAGAADELDDLGHGHRYLCAAPTSSGSATSAAGGLLGGSGRSRRRAIANASTAPTSWTPSTTIAN